MTDQLSDVRSILGMGLIVDHFIHPRTYEDGLAVECSCGWSYESQGRDESSQLAIHNAARAHENTPIDVGRELISRAARIEANERRPDNSDYKDGFEAGALWQGGFPA